MNNVKNVKVVFQYIFFGKDDKINSDYKLKKHYKIETLFIDDLTGDINTIIRGLIYARDALMREDYINITVHLDTKRDYYDGYTTEVYISADKLETEEEMNARLEKYRLQQNKKKEANKKLRQQQQEQEIITLLRLKKKYPKV
jgi:hypothetical protein